MARTFPEPTEPEGGFRTPSKEDGIPSYAVQMMQWGGLLLLAEFLEVEPKKEAVEAELEFVKDLVVWEGKLGIFSRLPTLEHLADRIHVRYEDLPRMLGNYKDHVGGENLTELHALACACIGPEWS